jgi:HlyD family secretion protein
MEEKSNNNKPAFTAEQLKQLLSLQNDLTHTKKTKGAIISQKVIVKISNAIKNTLYYLDRFVNFVTKNNDVDRNDVVQIARSPILFGVYVIILFVLVGGVWGSFAPLDSAATALGVVITSGNNKTINHQ